MNIHQDNIYTIEALEQFIAEYINAYTSKPILARGISQEEYEKEKQKQELLSTYIEECFMGDIKEKEFVKMFIKQLITAKANERDEEIVIEGYPKDYRITPDNIRYFLSLEKEELGPELAWRIIFNGYKQKYNDRAMGFIFDKYKLNKLRIDEFGDLMFFINEDDIRKIFMEEFYTEEISFQEHLDILVQLIYEKYKGLGVIDELMDQRIDEVAIGVTGVVDDIPIKHPRLEGKKIPKAYDSICIRYRGNPIHLKYLSFKSWEELERVNKLLVKNEQQEEFSQNQGYILGYGKDKSRRTGARQPFGECRVNWIRKFDTGDETNEELVKGLLANEPIKGWEKVVEREKLLMRGCATTIVSGPQNVGKTSKIKALKEYIYPFYAVRNIETDFEANFRRRNPNRDSYTVVGTEDISEEEGYNFLLRTSGDVIVIAEMRSDGITREYVKSGNRGGRFTISSYHVNRADLVPFEIANALLRTNTYQSLKEALNAALKAVKICVQVEKDEITGNRYYSLYEFVPKEIKIPKDFMNLQGQERVNAFMETMCAALEKLSSTEVYDTVPIVRYNIDKQEYIVENTISNELYRHLYMNMQLEEDRAELKRVFGS